MYWAGRWRFPPYQLLSRPAFPSRLASSSAITQRERRLCSTRSRRSAMNKSSFESGSTEAAHQKRHPALTWFLDHKLAIAGVGAGAVVIAGVFALRGENNTQY